MNNCKFIHLLLLTLVLLAACSSPQQSGRQIESFSFTDQDGESFGTDELKGEVWVANFIFTECETVCPPMTSEMAELQQMASEQELDVQFVSFTVDPMVDTPEKLKAYVTQFTEDDSNWHLLTGYSQEAIKNLALEQFQTIVQKPKTSDQVIHGTNFYLINPEGFIVNEFNYAEDDFEEKLLKEVKRYLQ